MSELTLLDCNASYGVRPDKQLEERWSLAHLLEDQELAGIAGALVRHTQALCYDYMHGNRRLLREISDHRDRLFPLWTIVPHGAGDFPAPHEMVREMNGNGVRAAAMFPRASGIPVSRFVLEPTAQCLADQGFLLVVPFPEFAGYAEARTFLEIFAAGPVLLKDASWAQWRSLVALMDEFPNVHTEFSTFQANRAIEWFCGRFGPERCLFGTDQPNKSPGAARAFLDFTLLEPAEARKVAGENLAALLGTELPGVPAPSQWHDSITEATRRGHPVPVPALDAHCHVLHDGADGAGGAYAMIKGDARGMMELTRRMGVEVTAMMSWNGTVGMDAVAGNELVLNVVRQFPEEIVGLTTLNPAVMSPEEMLQEMKKYHLEHGFPGLKPYVRTPIPYNDPLFEPWWEFADEHHLYGLFHIGVGGVNVVADIAGRHPNFHCLIAHSGGSYAFAKQVAEAAKQHPNIYAELTLTPVTNGVVEWLVGEIGADRVLFGTDAPMRDPRPQLGWVLYTRLTEDQKRLVLGENFRRILQQGVLPKALPEVLLRGADFTVK